MQRIKLLLVCALWCALSGCITKEIPHAEGPYGESVPNPSLFQTEQFQAKCFAYQDSSPKVLEQALNAYGRKGFRLAGFIVKDGRTTQLCLDRSY